MFCSTALKKTSKIRFTVGQAICALPLLELQNLETRHISIKNPPAYWCAPQTPDQPCARPTSDQFWRPLKKYKRHFFCQSAGYPLNDQNELVANRDLRMRRLTQLPPAERRSHLSKKSHVGQTNKEPFNSPSRQKRQHLIVGEEQLNHFYSQRTKVLILLNSFQTVVKFNRFSLLQKVSLR